MLYFIPWVLLMFGAIFAIPIASMLDRRKMMNSYEPEAAGAGMMDDDDLEPMEPLDDAGGGGSVLDEGNIQAGGGQSPEDAFGEAGNDDFSAFDEEFN